jgi:sucrose-6-phosphate hydrolase SacC (GH32 family)
MISTVILPMDVISCIKLRRNALQVQAHGGGIIRVNDTFFWFGESYKRPLLGDFLSEGVNLYSSTDLTSWQYEGLIFNATSQMTGMPVDPPFRVERPKVTQQSPL